MQEVALGFRVHSGWAAAVAISLDKKQPVVLLRRKLTLVRTFSYTFRQPYHTAAQMELYEAEKFVSGLRRESEELAGAGIRAMRKELAALEFEIAVAGLLLASGKKLPDFAKILVSHALIHTADGEFFRDAIRTACKRCKLPVQEIREKELAVASGKVLRRNCASLMKLIAALRKTAGPPWGMDEKLATLAAWISLAG